MIRVGAVGARATGSGGPCRPVSPGRLLGVLCLLVCTGLGAAGADDAPAWLSTDGTIQAGADGKARLLYQPEFRPAPWLAGQLAQYHLKDLTVTQVTPLVDVPIPPRARRAPPPVPGRLLLTGTREGVAAARDLLVRLDAAPRSVYVSILMSEVRCTGRQESGGSMYFDKGAGPNPKNTVFRGGATTFEPDDYLRSTLTGVAPFQGTSLKFGDMDVSGGAFEFTLRMLAMQGDAEFLAWPSLLVNEGTSGLMTSLEDVPQFLFESTNGQPRVRTISEQTGVKLRVSAVSVGRESAVLDLELWLRLPEEVTDPTAPLGTLRLRTREVKTRLTVRDREPLMLGGIVLHEGGHSRRGLPRPRALSIFDPLHSARLRTAESTEIVFLVRARIVAPVRTKARAGR